MYFIISFFPITYGTVDVHPTTSHTGPEQKYRYRYNLCTRLGVGGQHYSLAALPPGQQTQYSLSYYLYEDKYSWNQITLN